MKLRYKLAQEYSTPDDKSLTAYFNKQGIKIVRIGGILANEFGDSVEYLDTVTWPDARLLRTYEILLDEYELSAIKLCVDGVVFIENTSYVEFINSVRKFVGRIFKI